MEIKAILMKPYTDIERMNFIVENNHQSGYEIKETQEALEAWGLDDAELLEQAKATKYQEALEGAKNYIDTEAAFQFNENNSIEATDGNIGKFTAYALGFSTGTLEKVYWTTKEDNVIELDAQDVQAILLGLGEIQSNIWNIQFLNYKQQIDNATTVQEVENIVIDYEE